MITQKMFISKVQRIFGLSIMLMFLALFWSNTAQASIFSQIGPGSRGSDVISLQTFLVGYPNFYPSGLVTGYYGDLTTQAVQRFQAYYGIVYSGSPQTTGYGRVGPNTLSKINSLMGSRTIVTGGGMEISNIRVRTGLTSATVWWDTNVNSRSRVYYSTQPLQFTESGPGSLPIVSGTLQADNGIVGTHIIAIHNLAPNTVYNFVVESISPSGLVSVSSPSTFITNNI